MNIDPRCIEEMRARVELMKGSPTLLLALVENDAELNDTQSLLIEILRAAPLTIQDLGVCAFDAGPAKWAGETKKGGGDAFVLLIKPFSRLEAGIFAELLNAEREHLRGLFGPVILLVSRSTEAVLRKEAPDFYTWIAQSYELPPPEELRAMAPKLGVLAPEPLKPKTPPEDPIRFLHISDLHLRPGRVKRFDQDRVLQGLLGFLARDRASFPLDLIFVTGDLAQSGKAEEYTLVIEFLRKLMEISAVPAERVFVVPGNHDIDREIGRWLLRTLSKDEDSLSFFTEQKNRSFHEQKLGAYRERLKELFGEKRKLGLGVGKEALELVELKGARLGIASLNTAWFAQGDDDHEKLWLGEANIKEALDAMAEGGVDFGIALMHHPLEHLHEIERDAVEHWFERGFDLLLRGHLHKSRPRSMAGARGAFVELAGPAGYQGSQWENGCFLGEIRAKARTIRLRPYTYSSGPDPWVLNTKIFPDDEKDGYCRTFRVAEKIRFKRTAGGGLGALEDRAKGASPETPEQMRERALALLKQADHLVIQGEWDEALRIYREEALPAFERLSDVRSRAVTMSRIADILYYRGQLDEALRTHREEELPVFERLGDVHARAITMGRIAYILRLQGQFDEALRIHREEALPVFERLGDVQARAATMGGIAYILKERGQLDEALRIFREEVLPIFERLGDVRSRAFIMGGIAHIHKARGELGEAILILRDDVLPTLEQVGHKYEIVIHRLDLARCLVQQNHAGDRAQAQELLRLALKDAQAMGLKEAKEIEALQLELSALPQPGPQEPQALPTPPKPSAQPSPPTASQPPPPAKP